MANQRKRAKKGSYHHGDLERALVEAALATIQKQGLHALTLRSVGEQLGVSRTALYRHFKDKSELLARVAWEGFRALRLSLLDARSKAESAKRDPLEEMAAAYVGFGVNNPSHYRVMFSDFLKNAPPQSELLQEADEAYRVLVDTIASQQTNGRLKEAAPAEQLAQVVWALVHGMAMLGIDGLLRHGDADIGAIARFGWAQFENGLGTRKPC